MKKTTYFSAIIATFFLFYSCQEAAINKKCCVHIPGKQHRYHRKNIRTCPDGHPRAGGKAWIFSDEVIIE